MKAVKILALIILVPLNVAAWIQLVMVTVGLFFIKPGGTGVNVSYGIGQLMGALLLTVLVGAVLHAVIKSLRKG